MNIIFEGISGAGKTTVINLLCEELRKTHRKIINIEDLGYDTPLKKLLLEMVDENILMQEKYKFNTALYESLLLAANHHFIQEKLSSKKNEICIFDRDFISILSYQKEILKTNYKNWKEIYDEYKKIILFNLKKIDMIVYIKVPLKVSIDRTEKRNQKTISKEDISLLDKIYNNMDNEIKEFDNGQNVMYLNGMDDVQKNVKIILEMIRRNKNE